MISRVAIQTALVTFLNQAKFETVTYAVSTVCSPVATGTMVAPDTIEVNETSCRFSVDKNNKMNLSQKRDNWEFMAYIEFQTEVMFDTLLNELLTKVMYVEESGEFAKILLGNYQVAHPTRQSSQGGTAAVLLFTVSLN